MSTFLAHLAAPTAGSAALGRVVRTPSARVTLTGYVAVGFGLLGMLVPAQAALGWSVLMGVGFLSALAMWLFNRWLEHQPAAR